MLNIKIEFQEKVISNLITDLQPAQVEKEVPGFPAHLLFMAIRYIDHNSEERLMQSFLTAVISGIKKKVMVPFLFMMNLHIRIYIYQHKKCRNIIGNTNRQQYYAVRGSIC